MAKGSGSRMWEYNNVVREKLDSTADSHPDTEGCSSCQGDLARIEEQESELKKAKSELEKNLARAKTETLKEVRQLKAAHAVALERYEELYRSDLHRCKNNLERMRLKFIKKDDELRCDDLNEKVSRLKAKKDQTIACAKKAEARERSGGSKTEVKAPLVRGDVVSFSGRIRDLESDVSRVQGNVQKGNANLKECQHKLDAALIREKVLEGEINAKEFILKRKDELLKDLPIREELNAKLGVLRARVVEIQVMSLAESTKYIDKLEKDTIYHARVDAKIIA
ncbi:hypothetical protein GIB67_039282 [Kingdonia uniflora]|uniref:Uncharacterized protein n=1 Tax=Kingdonia uniflora TaxID=39325 RepID=A0A7J7MM55_9MAGN|nr:hypothetical protein GIB67_039282 [Kingdonia uniflora]